MRAGDLTLRRATTALTESALCHIRPNAENMSSASKSHRYNSLSSYSTHYLMASGYAKNKDSILGFGLGLEIGREGFNHRPNHDAGKKKQLVELLGIDPLLH